jgi:methylmalonyl-CoA mutase C-terminal domain/subunit
MTSERKIRFLMAKPGLDGHFRGAIVVSRALMEAGVEVIWTGNQTPEQIVEAAIQEDVDIIGLSIHSGPHLRLIPKVIRLLRERNVKDKFILVGGVIPKEDIPKIKDAGVLEFFGPGTPTEKITEYVRSLFQK